MEAASGAEPAPSRLQPCPAATSNRGMKSIHNRATSPRLRPIRFIRTRTTSVDHTEMGTCRPTKPRAHQTTDGRPMAIAVSIGLTRSQSR
jgi:hypothetical protein